MVKRRNLRPDPRRAMADLLAKQAAQTKALGTVPTGVKDMGESGDLVWTGRETGEPRSVRRFAVQLDDTAEQAEALAQRIADAEQQLEAAEGRLLEAREALAALDTRVKTSALQVSRGPLPPAGAPLGAQWLTPEGYLYVRVPCDEEVA